MSDAAIDPEALGWTRTGQDGFVALIGPFWTRHTDAGWRWGFLAGEQHMNGQGMVHGGMLASFIDQTLGVTVYHAVERRRAATIQLDTHFLDAARLGEFVEARTEVVRRTRSVVFMRGSLHTGERTLLTAHGIWKIIGV